MAHIFEWKLNTNVEDLKKKSTFHNQRKRIHIVGYKSTSEIFENTLNYFNFATEITLRKTRTAGLVNVLCFMLNNISENNIANK